MSALALRIDDIGACSKRYEVYSNWRCGNWLWLKYVPPFRRWGPYREMRSHEWRLVYDLLRRYRARLTVGVTAAWAESERRLIPFPERFPEEAAVLREGIEENLLEIANHGLTHCVVEGDAFKPRWFTGNRSAHREFWDSVPLPRQEEHIRRAQDILQGWCGREVVTFVPPGDVCSDATVEIARRHGLRYVSCRGRRLDGTTAPDDPPLPMLRFHDRDIVLNGVDWLARRLSAQPERGFCAVQDLAVAAEGIR